MMLYACYSNTWCLWMFDDKKKPTLNFGGEMFYAEGRSKGPPPPTSTERGLYQASPPESQLGMKKQTI